MENTPSFIQLYAEKIGKDVSAFTLDDWRSLAVEAADEIKALNREIGIFERKPPPPLGKPGRPRKHPRKTKNFLCSIFNEGYEYQGLKRLGRPVQNYHGLSIEQLNDLIFDVGKHPRAPKIKRELIRLVLSVLRNKVGGFSGLGAVERALRKYRAETIEKKPD